MRRALVVAHPDDESLWFGGLLIAEPGDWTVIACSIPRADPIRAWKFFDACEILGATGRLMPFDERGSFDWIRSIDLDDFDQIVTHGAGGEYGHPHHQLVHRFVAETFRGEKLASCYGAAPGEHRVVLTHEQWWRKENAIKAYSHVSPTDGRPKGEALIARYGGTFDLKVETYARA